MDLVIDFLPIVFSEKLLPHKSGHTQLMLAGFEDLPTAYINFLGILMKDHHEGVLSGIEEPVLNAIWALQVFKHNGWGVEIFSLREEVNILREWVSRYAPDLVGRVKKCSLQEVIAREKLANRPLTDMFIKGRNDFRFDKEVDWIEIMRALDRMGFLRKGLLPLEKVERTLDMGDLLKGGIFRDLVSDLKNKQREDTETRIEIIKSIIDHINHPEIADREGNMLVRAKIEGCLLRSVLKLLVRDRFDPVGCLILAQQDRGIAFDQMSSMLETDIE